MDCLTYDFNGIWAKQYNNIMLMLKIKCEENTDDSLSLSIYHLLSIPPMSIYCLRSVLSYLFSNPALVVFYTHFLWLPTPCPALSQHYFWDSPMKGKSSLKTFGSTWGQLGDKTACFSPNWTHRTVVVGKVSGVAPREGMCELHSGGQGASFTHRGQRMTQWGVLLL